MTNALKTLTAVLILISSLLGCAKTSKNTTPAGSGSGSGSGSGTATTNGAPPPDRVHLYAMLDTTPPISNTQGGEKIIFNKVGLNSGDCYKPEDGTFKCKEGFYDITAIVHWPGSTSQQQEAAICQVFLNLDGSPFPAAFATSPYMKGQACTAQFTVKLYVKEGQKFSVSATVTATGLNLLPATYAYGYFIVTGEKP